ncbi:MAG: LTA synthase family protein [Burkholderiaceae bacterium]|nr:LTA synthase family protein [Burkholderiaceae bacterium]
MKASPSPSPARTAPPEPTVRTRSSWLGQRASHQAAATAVAVFVALWSVSALTRIVLAAIGWRELDRDPAALLAAFGRGALIDALLAASTAAAILAFGALAHRAAPDGRIRRARRALGFAIAAAAIGFVAVAEVLFWDEFGARFNFIAVDYLIYTVEVIGNIRESYPLPLLLGAVAAFGLAAAWLRERAWPVRAQAGWTLRRRGIVALLAALASVIAWRAGMSLNDGVESAAGLRDNVGNQELARNGFASFVAALRDNELSFRRFYATIGEARVAALAGPWPRSPAPQDRTAGGAAGALRRVAARAESGSTALAPGHPRHVVIVEVESLSAAFLGAFGNRDGLTPNLDRLAREGVLFTELFATGTRTVRGLEALSAGLPPLPGQSLVRRPGNGDLQTLGSALREHGFDTEFLYGGYGYFDNMNAYFAANGYRVRDRRDIPSERIGFENIWGISDEYLFDDAIAEMDRAASDGRRHLLHLMTTSNHRPYTYPDGRIDIPSKTGRLGAVKYTDWAIGHFIELASKRPWFDDTLFVIVADHCASVAGKTRIPPARYRIPAIFYSPKHLAPGTVSTLASQIDLPPTIVGWLGLDDGGRFFGQNLFGATVRERAFLGNYQEIGMLTPGEGGVRDLVVLSPRRRVAQYRIEANGSERPVPPDAAKVEQAIAEYQLADDLVQSHRYRAAPAPVATPPARARSGQVTG